MPSTDGTPAALDMDMMSMHPLSQRRQFGERSSAAASRICFEAPAALRSGCARASCAVLQRENVASSQQRCEFE